MNNHKNHKEDTKFPFSFREPSYESYIFSYLYKINQFLESEKQPHAFFGGVAVSAYSGHLPRALHDFDIIIPKGEEIRFVSYLCSQGFIERSTRKTHQAHFRKFIYEDDRYQIIIAIFPGEFTLINLADSNLSIIGTYDFGPALEHGIERSIYALGGNGTVSVITVPIEDLIISKLWPTFEPKLIHDLILLLGSEDAKHLDLSYLAARMKQVENMRPITLETLNRFLSVYDKSLWSKGLPKHKTIKAQARCLIETLNSKNLHISDNPLI